MKFGSSAYGYRQLKTERRLQKLSPDKLAEKLRKKLEKRQKADARLTERQWGWIKRNDLPDTFVNDKRAYYRAEYLKSDHWAELRGRKLKDSPVCEDCGSRFRVEPHHLRYKNLYDVELEDLKTLCRKHHALEHERLDREKKLLASKGFLGGVPLNTERTTVKPWVSAERQ